MITYQALIGDQIIDPTRVMVDNTLYIIIISIVKQELEA